MRELTVNEVEMVDGGKMSTQTKIIMGVAFVTSPLIGAFVALGYYANNVEC